MKISATTAICGIIGDPVEHSVSPVMQNAAFEALGLDFVYLASRVESQDLEHAVQGLRALRWRGANVTIPHKVTVLEFLDEIDEIAQHLGAVNTIVNNNGWLKGYNTDAAGFSKTLTEEGIDLAGRKVTVLGAGGAARAVSFVLADKGANLTILNRDENRARRLADSLMRLLRREVAVEGLKKKGAKKILLESEILVNTTSVGMLPESGASPVPPGLIHKGQIVFDIIYNPLKTPLLVEAEEAGAKTIGGLEMLVQQGAAAFAMWTGRKAPVEDMRKAAEQALMVEN
ncbi:MAG TPA: shikimate dehydrogenase [Dehalococcoidales bacterium]|nr:shikimate dehydrogenase [Dehalococcoidales bacterium]